MAIKGVGIDIIEIDRIKEAVEKYGDTFLKRVFTDGEINYCRRRKSYRIPELAVRFAAKEAYSKAIGTGIKGFGRKNHGIGWKEIEIVNNSHGKPLISIKGKASAKVQLSLSHSRDYAVASVYVEA
ncbi:MAG: holo-ACP synthase [Candidatus Margulisbacteria bacterium]|nr:holo-ACP synthase [Candidatus Margulisiibacteriota bacterium]